jgi:hypothetical protein
MKKEYWEVLSFAPETAAFFLAAPDFLGERVLRNIGRMFDDFLRPIGLEAATVARDLRGIVTIGWDRPWPRIWQIAIVLLADVSHRFMVVRLAPAGRLYARHHGG